MRNVSPIFGLSGHRQLGRYYSCDSRAFLLHRWPKSMIKSKSDSNTFVKNNGQVFDDNFTAKLAQSSLRPARLCVSAFSFFPLVIRKNAETQRRGGRRESGVARKRDRLPQRFFGSGFAGLGVRV